MPKPRFLSTKKTLDAKRQLKANLFGKRGVIATQVAYRQPCSLHCWLLLLLDIYDGNLSWFLVLDPDAWLLSDSFSWLYFLLLTFCALLLALYYWLFTLGYLLLATYSWLLTLAPYFRIRNLGSLLLAPYSWLLLLAPSSCYFLWLLFLASSSGSLLLVPFTGSFLLFLLAPDSSPQLCQALLSAPNPDDPLANDVAELWKVRPPTPPLTPSQPYPQLNEPEALRNAREWTKKYAAPC